MKIISQKLFFIAAFLFFSLLGNQYLKAQDNTLYNMQNLPQSMQLNPAFQHKCKFFIELPAISSLYFNYSMPFALNDVIAEEANDNGRINFNLDKFESTLDDVSYFTTDVSYNILAFGFKAQNGWYFGANISNKTYTRFALPKDAFAIRHGTWDWDTNTPVDRSFSDLGVDATNFLEIGASVSKEINKTWTVGGRLKYLKGLGDFSTAQSEIFVQTDPVTFDLSIDNSTMEINSSFPVEIIDENNDNVIDTVLMVEEDYVNSYVLNGNNGIGIDLGVVYRFSDNLTFSASVIDLGFITWASDYSYNFKGTASYSYSGINLEHYLDDAIQNKDIGDMVADQFEAIEDAYDFGYEQKKYTTYLKSKVFLGANFKLNDYFNFGAVSRTDFYKGEIQPSLTLSANTNFFKAWTASVSYSMINGTYNNLGFGLGMKYGPWQLYFITDKLPVTYAKDTSTSVWVPYYSRNMNFRFGLGLIFGCKDKVDLPSIYDAGYF